MRSRLTRDIPILVGIGVLLVGGLIWMSYAQNSVPASVDLTKDEAVQLLQLQFQLESVLRVRDQYVVDLYTKHGIRRDQYDLNVFMGKFTLIQPKEAKKK